MITRANLEGNYRLWGKDATSALLELAERGMTQREMAVRFGRTPKAIKAKLRYERERVLWR